jgi:hypothetical protein
MAYGTVNADVIGNTTGYSLGAGNASAFKNRIINGAMVIDQRNAGASSTAITTYTVDRWAYYSRGVSGKFTWGQNLNATTPPIGFSKYLGFQSSSSYSVSSTDAFIIQQIIEGFNTSDLGWGTANAKTVTISFWAYSSLTGTFTGAIQAADSSRSNVFSYTISNANTWTYVTATIVGDTSGTWVGASNAGSLALIFSLGAGSTFNTTAGTWNSGDYRSVSGAQSVVGTSGATWYMTGAQLEVGSSATGFEYRSIGTEFSLCQRYFETNCSYGVVPTNGSAGGWYSSSTPNTIYPQNIQFAVQKRAAPTMSLYRDASNGSSDNIWHYYTGSAWVSLSSQTAQSRTTSFYTNSNVSPTANASWVIAGVWAASAEL